MSDRAQMQERIRELEAVSEDLISMKERAISEKVQEMNQSDALRTALRQIRDLRGGPPSLMARIGEIVDKVLEPDDA